jgi:hypothetical protein
MTLKPGWLGAVVPLAVFGLLGWVYGGSLADRDRQAAERAEPAVASAAR